MGCYLSFPREQKVFIHDVMSKLHGLQMILYMCIVNNQEFFMWTHQLKCEKPGPVNYSKIIKFYMFLSV